MTPDKHSPHVIAGVLHTYQIRNVWTARLPHTKETVPEQGDMTGYGETEEDAVSSLLKKHSQAVAKALVAPSSLTEDALDAYADAYTAGYIAGAAAVIAPRRHLIQAALALIEAGATDHDDFIVDKEHAAALRAALDALKIVTVEVGEANAQHGSMESR